MRDLQALLERQAQWQKRRASLSWSEKVRMAEAVRESVIRLRASAPDARTPLPSEREPTKNR